MALPVIFEFPAADTDAICLTQTVAANTNLVINGPLLDTAKTVNGIYNVTLPGIQRRVSVTSTAGDDLSTVLFTVYGFDLQGTSISGSVASRSGAVVALGSVSGTKARARIRAAEAAWNGLSNRGAAGPGSRPSSV